MYDDLWRIYFSDINLLALIFYTVWNEKNSNNLTKGLFVESLYLLPATQAKFPAINYSAEEKIWVEHQKPFLDRVCEFPSISKNIITYWFYKVRILLNLWNGKLWSSDNGIDNIILWFRVLLCVLDSSRNTQERLEKHLQNTHNILENLMKWSRYWWHLTWNVCIFKKSNFEKNIV